MAKYLFFFLIGLPLGLLGQSSDVQVLGDSLNQGWTTLDKGWNYQKGDDLSWAQPNYDDSQWSSVVNPENGNLNSFEDNDIAGKNEIIWFRKRVLLDSLFSETIIFRIGQAGASEIYLDGKLLHSFGVVSRDPENFVHKSAPDDIFVLPFIPGREHLLAVRYATGSQDFPLYNGSSAIEIQLTTISVLNSPDLSRNNSLIVFPVGFLYFLISLGATSLIFILFFTLFLFFPKERINGYFALSTFCMSVWIIFNFIGISADSHFFWPNIFSGILLLAGILLMLFCIYRIFNRAVGWWFWTICFLFLATVVSNVVYPIDDYTVPLYLYLITIIVLSARSLKTNKEAALIFICCIGLIFIYFASGLVFSALGIDNSAFNVYASGLSFMLLPLSIAIYLGYSFSQRTKSLGLQLLAVKKLSFENAKILSEQKSTLEKEVTQRTLDLKRSLENLKSTQGQLIQSEKMASLGELTAGIAHEIQNPLNFVNNFSEINIELIEELQAELKKGEYEEALTISNDVKDNQQKINHHGKRADAIVKGMLQHSRKSSAEKEPTDINKLADEYLRLAYHGLRAKDKSFNATLETDFDERIGKVKVIPQDLGRVILNLITNAFYAVNEKKSAFAKANSTQVYVPTVSVITKRNSPLEGGKGGIIISVKDNGNGIPKHVVDKIFQPFFTTKPTGEGTGLGLSMSYDIITKGHGGELKVETKENGGTEFIISIPNQTI